MESWPSMQRINFQDFIDRFNNNVNGEKVSDDSFLKHAVYEENSDYKKSIIIASAADASHSNSQGIHKLEIYRDRFGNGHKMVFSQKVYLPTSVELFTGFRRTFFVHCLLNLIIIE